MTDRALIEDLPLAADFPAVGAGASGTRWWRKVLKGADFERRLVRATADGIKVQPLYKVGGRSLRACPELPLCPRRIGAGSVAGGWDIRQLEIVDDPGAANAAILEGLEGGATSIQLRIGQAPDVGLLDRVLADVLLDLAPIGLEANADFLAAAKALLDLAARRGIAADSLRADLNADPWVPRSAAARWTRGAGWRTPLACARGRRWVGRGRWRCSPTAGPTMPAAPARRRSWPLPSRPGSPTCARWSTRACLPPTAARQIGFALATDADFFLSFAKFRALRRLWGQVLEVAGADAAMPGLRLHAETAERMFTRRDPQVNILRGTVAAFAAAAGGAGSITVLPFDHALGAPSALARRIARNTQLVLLEESAAGPRDRPCRRQLVRRAADRRAGHEGLGAGPGDRAPRRHAGGAARRAGRRRWSPRAATAEADSPPDARRSPASRSSPTPTSR